MTQILIKFGFYDRLLQELSIALFNSYIKHKQVPHFSRIDTFYQDLNSVRVSIS